MTPAEIHATLAAIDAALTFASRMAERIDQARAEGLVTVDEQQARLTKIDELRNRIAGR